MHVESRFRRGFSFLLVVCCGIALCGCGHHQESGTPSAQLTPGGNTQQPMARTSATEPSASAAGNPASTEPSTPADAQVLANKTTNYVQEMSRLMEQRKPSTTQPSQVQWVDANSGQPTTEPDAANRTATLAAAHMVEEPGPMILPESADHLTSGAGGPAPMVSDDLEKRLAGMVHDYPLDMANQLDYELLRFSRDESTPDMASISNLPAQDREIVSSLMDALNNFRDAVRADGNPPMSRKIQPLLDMADRLRAEAELTIPTIALCTRVDSFGVYTPLDSPRFGAGASNEVIVYCEVANFTSVFSTQKRWETKLSEEMTLYTESGLAVWPEKSDAELFLDVARNRRHDFFIPRRIRLPESLTIGRYLLKVTITDVQSNRIAEATTPIEIIAQ